MVRNIEFRGISTFTKKWIYGNYTIIDGLPSIVENSIEFIDGTELRCESWGYVLPETVGQYTGKIDKEKNKIYSGDLLKDKDGNIYKVLFSEHASAFIIKRADSSNSIDILLGNYDTEMTFEVIGNTYDNSGLLNDV